MIQAVTEGFRLSPQQKQLWSQTQGSLNQVQCVLHLRGNLQPQQLQAAVKQVVARHEILRTSFDSLSGMTLPLQRIGDTPPIWETVVAELPLDSLLQQQRSLPFPWAQESLTHCTLIPLSPQEHVLTIRLPALCADAVSMNNLVAEIAAAYAGTPLTDEPLQYADIAEWQNELLEAKDTATGRTYWQQQDVSSLAITKLPLGKKVSAAADFVPQSHGVVLPCELVATLNEIAHSHNIPLANLFLSSWQTFLWRLTGQASQVLGISVTGRKHEELQTALGCFAKNLPLVTSIQADTSFLDVLASTHTSWESATQWQDYFTWEDVSEKELGFFPLGFEWLNIPPDLNAAGVSFEMKQLYSCSEKFDLKLTCLQHNQQLITEFYYNEKHFSAVEIEQLGQQFVTFLASIAQSPERTIDQLAILSESDRQKILVEWNSTPSNYPSYHSISQLFTAQVQQTPEAIALRYELGQSLSYSQLNARANQLAHYLQHLGVQPEVPVGLLLNRSVEMIVGMLAILKAGGAYVPLDPTLPAKAIEFRLRDSQASIILTERSLLACLPSDSPRVVNVEDGETIDQFPRHNPTSNVIPENLVYLIYTSGSTGQAKGVAVEHQHLLNYVHSIQERLNLQPGFHYALVSALAADLGNTMIFPSLCSGGCLHILSANTAKDPNALAAYTQQHPIDCLKIVPSHLQALLVSSQAAHFLPRQRLILGGEALNGQLIQQLQPHLAATCQVFNHYGPTEATVGVLTHEISPETSLTGTVPLGRPLANTQVYILDEHLQPVPVGVPGELYIGGATVARGYWQQDHLTAQRFVDNPFNQQGRLYKTGDLACYLSDGTITFLGRADSQVKIHGFRVELGEIESVITQHNAVQQAVVSLLQETLVAYLVWSTPQAKEAQLREYLAQQLPQYMLPTVWVSLASLPLTPNGKVDRQALPQPTRVSQTYVAPRTPQEQVLCEIWAEALGENAVGIHDNFFSLGGDSILSIRAIAKATEAGLTFTPQQLFEHPTIAELATIAQPTSAFSTEQGQVTGVVPLTPIQCWFFEQNLAQPSHWNQAVLLMVSGLEWEKLQQVVPALVHHHDALRLRFSQSEAGWQAVHREGETIIPCDSIDLSDLSPSAQAKAITTHANELHTRLNLAEGVLMQVALFNLGVNQPYRLLIIIHHLVIDGVSWRILLEDLQTAYGQLQQGQEIQLAPKTTSFQQWSQHLQQYAKAPQCQDTLDYWQTQLEKPITPLPTDFHQGKNTVDSSHTVSVTLSAQDTQALLQEVPSAYQTQINDVLLTALVQTWQQETGTSALRIDLEGHGRESLFTRVNVSRTVGWFTTIFPVHLQLPSETHPGAVLKAIKEQLRQIPHSGIDYGILRYLAQVPALQMPTADVRFNYLGQFDSLLSASSLLAIAPESSGIARRGTRPYLLDINGVILDGCLRLDWVYSDAFHRAETIQRWANTYLDCLRSLIHHCQSTEAGGYTPSDFPEMNFSQEELDALLADL